MVEDNHKYLKNRVDLFIKKYPLLNDNKENLLNSINILIKTFESNKKLLICGNGGSCSDSEHISSELMKSFKIERSIPNSIKKKYINFYDEQGSYLASKLEGGLPTISLTSNTSLLTAISNDIGYDLAFAQQLNVYGNNGDALLILSTSGKSKSVINACMVANVKNIEIIGLLGNNINSIDHLCSSVIKIPLNETYEIQEYHEKVYHFICDCLEKYFFGMSK